MEKDTFTYTAVVHKINVGYHLSRLLEGKKTFTMRRTTLYGNMLDEIAFLNIRIITLFLKSYTVVLILYLKRRKTDKERELF